MIINPDLKLNSIKLIHLQLKLNMNRDYLFKNNQN